jgi:hypothetical protein
MRQIQWMYARIPQTPNYNGYLEVWELGDPDKVIWREDFQEKPLEEMVRKLHRLLNDYEDVKVVVNRPTRGQPQIFLMDEAIVQILKSDLTAALKAFEPQHIVIHASQLGLNNLHKEMSNAAPKSA